MPLPENRDRDSDSIITYLTVLVNITKIIKEY